MKKDCNNLSDFESESEVQKPIITEQFTKFLNRFYQEGWFNKPNYLAVFMHLLKNVNWHKSFIIYKNNKYKVNIGECVISQYDLSKTLKIPQATVHRILHFFQNIGEIELRPTNGFTLVSINYLNENKKMNCERIAGELRMVTSIDKIDNIDNIDKAIEINFVEDKLNLNNEEEKDMTKINASVGKTDSVEPKSVGKTKSVKEPSFIDTLLTIWQEEYHVSRSMEYVVITGKDTQGISKLLKLFRKQHPEFDTQAMTEHFRSFFKQVLAIQEQFISKACNPAFIYSQINQINMILNGSKEKTSSSSVGYATGVGNYNLPLK